MSSLEDLEDLEQAREQREDDKEKKKKDGNAADKDGDAEMQDAEEDKNDGIDPEILNSSTQDIVTRKRLLENDIRVMKQEHQRLQHEKTSMGKKIEENLEKIENNR